MVEIELTDEQRFIVLGVFEAQSIRVDDYASAISWLGAFDALAGEWDWRNIQRRGLQAIENPSELSNVRLSEDEAKVVAFQLLMYIRSGCQGDKLWPIMRVLEMIREVAPDAVPTK